MEYHLQEIANKAAGLYFLVHDNSKVDTVPTTSRMRLAFINVPKGPVNCLVYVEKGDTAGFKEIFGDIDRRDERNGNFSVRTCLWMLEAGPILVCNLREFDDTKDLAGMIGLSTTLQDVNKLAQKVPYTQLFNTERLWWNDPKQLLKQETASWFNIGNVGNQDISIFIRKSTAKGYDVTIKEWYAALNRELPLYVNPSDYVSETMVDVFVFKTNFGDNSVNMANENYGYLFDENGLKPTVEQSGQTVDALQVLSGISDAQYIGAYTGSLVPGMVDAAGNSMQIELNLNSVTSATGITAKFDEVNAEELGDWEGSVDEDGNPIYELDKSKRPFAIDLVGHSLVHIDNMGEIEELQNKVNNVLSYTKDLKTGTVVIDLNKNSVELDNVYDADRVNMTAFIDEGKLKDVFKFYVLDAVNVAYGDRVVGIDGNLKRVTKSTLLGTKTIIEGIGTSKMPIMKDGEIYPQNAEGAFVYPLVPVTDGELENVPVGINVDKDNIFFRASGGGNLRALDESKESFRTGDPEAPVEKLLFKTTVDFKTLNAGDHVTYTGADFTGNLQTDYGETQEVTFPANSVFEVVGMDTFNGQEVLAVKLDPVTPKYVANTEVQFSENDKPLDQVTGEEYEVVLSPEREAELKDKYGTTYNFIECECEDRVNLGHLDILDKDEDNHLVVTLDDGTEFKVLKTVVCKQNPIFEDNYRLKAIVLPAYKTRKDQFTNGTSTQQSAILDVMNKPNIVKGLKNAQDFRPRYIVDAFKSYIEPSYKYQYGVLVKELSEKSTMFCRAILNEAFAEDMINSKNPYFRKTPTSNFDAAYIEQGGNPKLPGSNVYEKAKDGDRYCFFFGPGLLVNHYGQTITAPPAGVVSKAFLEKYTAAFPYSIVANNSGVITGANVSGVEIDFDQDDRAPLERVGYNAIIKELGKGLLIYGNNTAQYRMKTSFSKIHVSELVAFIQEQMMTIMKDYIFEFNDYQNRLEVKKRADAVMNQILDNGGVLYFENICSAANNTTEIIENDMGILDTIIVAGRGAEKWVHRTYLEKAGNISGFELL